MRAFAIYAHEFDFYYTELHGTGNTARNNTIKHIQDNGGKEAYRDCTWLRKNAMEECIIEKDNPKIIDDISDPIFVLEKHVGTKTIEEITKTLLKELNNEIK